MTVAMITHGPAGDTFWDTIRKGAEAAAANDGVDLQYTSDGDATAQATLIQNAVNQGVDAIAVTDPNTGRSARPSRPRWPRASRSRCSTPARATGRAWAP